MEFFQKIKKAFGFAGVKVSLDVPGTFSRTGDTISGDVKITSKSDRHVFEINVYLEEDRTTGRGENKQTKNCDLGEWKYETEFDIKAGETKKVPFILNYSLMKSENDHVTESSKAGKAPGGTGKMPCVEKSEYWLNAMVDVE